MPYGMCRITRRRWRPCHAAVTRRARAARQLGELERIPAEHAYVVPYEGTGRSRDVLVTDIEAVGTTSHARTAPVRHFVR